MAISRSSWILQEMAEGRNKSSDEIIADLFSSLSQQVLSLSTMKEEVFHSGMACVSTLPV